MKQVIEIARLYIKITFQQRSVLISSLLMPVIFTFVLAQAMGGPNQGNLPTSWPLAVIDKDQSSLSQDLVQRLETDPVVDVQMIEDQDAALAALEDRSLAGMMVIPSGFELSLLGGQDVVIEFYAQVDNITRSQVLEQAITAAYTELSGSLEIAGLTTRVSEKLGMFGTSGNGQTSQGKTETFEAAYQDAESAWTIGAPVQAVTTQVSRVEVGEQVVATGASQSSPGMMVMFAMFFMLGGGTALMVEREQGTLRRLVTSPLSKSTILFGKFLGIFLTGLVQMGLMILIGMFLLGVHWGNSPWALVTMVVVYGFTTTALGIMIAALASTTSQANALGTILVMAMSALGGAWWPIEIVPATMQKFALTFPTGWAMRGFQDIITRGLALNDILLEAGVLACFGLVFLGVGIWRFRYE